MCVSARALAILTLPNGDSRSHQPGRGGDYLRIANEGGCVDLGADVALEVRQSFRNTAVVSLVRQDGVRGPPYVVPLIDLQAGAAGGDTPAQVAASAGVSAQVAAPADVPAQVAAPADVPSQVAAPADVPAAARGDVHERRAGPPGEADTGAYVVSQRFAVAGGSGTIELLLDRRITPAVFTDLWRSGGAGVVDVGGAALLPARLRLMLDGRARARSVGYPLAALTALDTNGETFSLQVDTTQKQAGRIAEEKLVPVAHGLVPAFGASF